MRALIALPLLLATVSAPADSVDTLLQGYLTAGASDFSAARGHALWQREVTPAVGSQTRHCGSCHGTDLAAPGKHVRTGKSIDAMAPSTNPSRLSDPKKIEKWFKRNCKWTWGRECTAQEKGDLLQFLRTL